MLVCEMKTRYYYDIIIHVLFKIFMYSLSDSYVQRNVVIISKI